MRANARRNRDAILVAARKVFAREGLNAPLEAIAQAAGVTRTTMYRHFGSREELIRSSFADSLAELEATINDLGDEHSFFRALEVIAEQNRRDVGFIDLITRSMHDAFFQPTRERFGQLMNPALRRAQEAGLIRRDLTDKDVVLVIDLLGAAARRGGPEYSKRALILIERALRPG